MIILITNYNYRKKFTMPRYALFFIDITLEIFLILNSYTAIIFKKIYERVADFFNVLLFF